MRINEKSFRLFIYLSKIIIEKRVVYINSREMFTDLEACNTLALAATCN